MIAPKKVPVELRCEWTGNLHCSHWKHSNVCCCFCGSTNIPELTLFQVLCLEDAARSALSTYLMITPDPLLDDDAVLQAFRTSNAATDQLIELGFITDISGDFLQNIDAHVAGGGRKFRVLRITAIGKAMFNANSASTFIN